MRLFVTVGQIHIYTTSADTFINVTENIVKGNQRMNN